MMQGQKKARQLIAKVASNKMNQTVLVEIERKIKHKLYGKYMKSFSKICVHDEKNISRIGDLVMIQECRPISKTKHWILTQIVKKSQQDLL